MWRVTKLGHKWYAVQFDTIIREANNLEDLTNDGDPTIIVGELHTAQEIVSDLGDGDIIVEEPE